MAQPKFTVLPVPLPRATVTPDSIHGAFVTLINDINASFAKQAKDFEDALYELTPHSEPKKKS